MNHTTTGARMTTPFLLALLSGAVLFITAGCDSGQPAAASASAPATSSASEAKSPDAAASAPEVEGVQLSAEEVQRAGLKVETLTKQIQADAITVTATIRPNQDRMARVAPRVEGRIVQVQAQLGMQVRAGQTLAVLDSLALGEAQAAVLQAQSNHRVAQADFKRAQSLVADEIIPQRDYLRAQAELEKAAAELRAQQDRLRLLGGSARADGTAGSTFALTAPLAGTVVQKNATVGELGTPSAALFTVADLSQVWIEANLTEDTLAKVHVGCTATVTVNAYPGERFSGRVAYIASILDKESRTAAARIEVDNRDGRLKPEMFATAVIDTGGGQREALSVPDAAIVLLQGQPTVFVEAGGRYAARAIEPGDKVSGRTVIRSGVVEGEKVVTVGAYALKARLLKSQIGDAH